MSGTMPTREQILECVRSYINSCGSSMDIADELDWSEEEWAGLVDKEQGQMLTRVFYNLICQAKVEISWAEHLLTDVDKTIAMCNEPGYNYARDIEQLMADGVITH